MKYQPAEVPGPGTAAGKLTGCRIIMARTLCHLNGRSEKRVLANIAKMPQTLGAFGLNLPDAPKLDAALARLTEPA